MQRPIVYITRRIPTEAVDLLNRVAEVRRWDNDDPIPRDVLLREVGDYGRNRVGAFPPLPANLTELPSSLVDAA